MKYKKCNKCLTRFPITQFYKSKGAKDGYENQCKKCVRNRRQRRYAPKIYEIHDLIEDKYYIGQTIKPLSERISHHFTRAKRQQRGNSGLYNSMRNSNFDRSKFPIKTLETLSSKEKMDEAEKKYIKLYINDYGENNVYNNTSGGHKDFTMPKRQKIYFSRAKGVKNKVVVYDLKRRKWVGEFETLQEISKKIGFRIPTMKNGDWGLARTYLYFYGGISNARFDEIMQLIEVTYDLINKSNGISYMRKKHNRRGKNNVACKYSDETILRIKQLLIKGIEIKKISQETGVPTAYVSAVNRKSVRADLRINGYEDKPYYYLYRRSKRMLKN
ncbi:MULTISPECIES: GIY-YIG nuclease family protein [Limosilactobacillus]|uniref:GIY-YIG domain-containing protein n=2 Tax=Limosilactobacillus reuteri TaxID=1598 RepID=A0A1V4FJ44_LIMRT|nr:MULTISPECIES: GIY-YIG nuclease family protein [Limosilactobacillus]MCC4359096.1 GIY-YIG nuclease family protein [Limosilactobacillus reuteri]MCC4361763.1 GIY-YIG nuclease family protein [Limosilactobacillus reuteri]MCC4365400.1 GIY-YIG nuclease family protein [Limosilactobacillus reuteri]MCC4508519.1 GIY-YIG nuclease family protein [Limosilactobacillus reuteri]MCD7123270.1 GIY-YIG nuclease family protein [Limosilactobacillus caviae]